jgi:hypothetical protein
MKTKTFAVAAAAAFLAILAGCMREPTRSPAQVGAVDVPAAPTAATAPCDAPEPPKRVDTKPVFAMCTE